MIAAAVGAALVGALVALQLVDDGGTTSRSSDQTDHVKGESASLAGRFTGADGFTVQVRIVSPDGEASATADPDGRFHVTGLAPGPVEVSWVGETTANAGGGITVGAQRSGPTQVTLDAGRNTLALDF